jgi:hypothetical protein
MSPHTSAISEFKLPPVSCNCSKRFRHRVSYWRMKVIRDWSIICWRLLIQFCIISSMVCLPVGKERRCHQAKLTNLYRKSELCLFGSSISSGFPNSCYFYFDERVEGYTEEESCSSWYVYLLSSCTVSTCLFAESFSRSLLLS